MHVRTGNQLRTNPYFALFDRFKTRYSAKESGLAATTRAQDHKMLTRRSHQIRAFQHRNRRFTHKSLATTTNATSAASESE